MLFPTIVNKAEMIHTLGSELPIKENCNVLQMVRSIFIVELKNVINQISYELYMVLL